MEVNPKEGHLSEDRHCSKTVIKNDFFIVAV